MVTGTMHITGSLSSSPGGFSNIELSGNTHKDINMILSGKIPLKYYKSGSFSNAYTVRVGHYLSLNTRSYIVKMRTRESSLKYEEEMARLLIAANELNSDLLELGIQIINPLFANNQLFITEQIRGGNISENKRNKFIFSLSTIMEQFLKGKKGDPLWKDIMCDYHKLDNYIKSGGIVYWIDPFFNYTEI